MADLIATPAVLILRPHWFAPVLVILVLVFLITLGLAMAYMWRIHSVRKEQRCVRRARLAQAQRMRATHDAAYHDEVDEVDDADDAVARELQERRLEQMYLAEATPTATHDVGFEGTPQQEVFDEETLTGDAAVADRYIDDSSRSGEWEADSEEDYVVRSVLPEEREAVVAYGPDDVTVSETEAPQTREGLGDAPSAAAVAADEVHEIPRRPAKESVNSLDQYIWG